MRRRAREGFAMVAVLLVLLALLVLCTPFLVTVQNADKSSSQIADRATTRIALDSATRHARGFLAASHSDLDPDPYFDSVEEIDVTNRFADGFLDANDPNGVMWDVDVTDESARICLNSAPPQMIANLLGQVARLTGPIDEKATELVVNSTAGFDPEGFVWVDRELMGYLELSGSGFGKLQRGLAATEGEGEVCGPQRPSPHAQGSFVIDQRAWAIARWRVATSGRDPRRFDSIEQLAEAATLSMTGSLGDEALTTLGRTGTVYGDVGAGASWQRAARLVADVVSGPEACQVQVDEGRWFNVGTTVLVSDGRSSELGLVALSQRGRLTLADPLVNGYGRYETVVVPLARRPVNLNTASPEVLGALFENLKLRGTTSRITSGKARRLVEVVLASRPFEGFEDFCRRVVLPGAGLEALPEDAPVVPGAFENQEGLGSEAAAGFLEREDALALYKNGLNANDNELEFSTMPFSFATRDVYTMDVRASVNARSGVERTAGVREQVELVVPQRDLMHVWGRQEDFDLSLRLSREARGWMSGPAVTTRFDPIYGSDPPSRARAHLGPYDSTPSVDPLAPDPSYTFANREQHTRDWIQAAPVRSDEAGLRAGRVLHFDNETRHAEGRYLPDGPPFFAPDDNRLGWLGGNGLVRPLHGEMWIHPRELTQGARFLDVGGGFVDSDRISLLLDTDDSTGALDLVLRVRDGTDDHPDTPAFEEVAEVRYPVGQGPGLPLNTWTHVAYDVRGNRPDQMTLMVDGRLAGENPIQTRLASALGANDNFIAVESSEGFPDECVLRIGDELIEARNNRPGGFDATYETTGRFAGFGGRAARELFKVDDPETAGTPVTPRGLSHPQGTPVTLYGYSLPMSGSSNVSSSSSTLTEDLGMFRVGRVRAVVRQGSNDESQGEPIFATVNGPLGAFQLRLGHGMRGIDSNVEALVLMSPDEPNEVKNVADTEQVMRAFSPSGGYAAILDISTNANAGFNLIVGGFPNDITHDDDGAPIGGVEIVYYSGVQGDRLIIDQSSRGNQNLSELAEYNRIVQELDLKRIGDPLSGRSFIFRWNPAISQVGSGVAIEDVLYFDTMVIPISVPIAGARGTGFPAPARGLSEFAQITHVDTTAHLTEWVRYDDVAAAPGRGQHLVRSNPEALLNASRAAHAGRSELPQLNTDQDDEEEEEDPNTPGDSGGGTQPVDRTETRSLRAPRSAAIQSTYEIGEPVAGPLWYPHMGLAEDQAFPVTEATRTQFQFRGVFGTGSHLHQVQDDVTILPVFRVIDEEYATPVRRVGHPGRFDYVTLSFDDPALPVLPVQVHRAYRPRDYPLSIWNVANQDFNTPVTVSLETRSEQGVHDFTTYVALTAVPGGAVAGGTGSGPSPVILTGDTREIARMVKFPSGELPREAANVALGGSFQGSGNVPAALLDEAAFGRTEVLSTRLGQHSLGAALLVETDFGPGATGFQAQADTLRIPFGDVPGAGGVMLRYPQDAGLLRIGDEILCYDSVDAGSGTFGLAPGGRALMGSEEQPHQVGESVFLLEGWRVSILVGALGADAYSISVADASDFPQEGTLRIGDELLHYTWREGNTLIMPRASSEPGAMDGEAGGIFRGRFGTIAAAHPAGTPVIVFPCRYWDGWNPATDAPELHYFGLSLDRPNAYWGGAFWDVEEDPAGGPRVGVLQRTDPDLPWDTHPEDSDDMELHYDGVQGGEGNAISRQADRIDWRIFFEHAPDSFDPVLGLSHSWKRTARLRFFGVNYVSPGLTLRRVDR